jgi:hypothetical protein
MAVCYKMRISDSLMHRIVFVFYFDFGVELYYLINIRERLPSCIYNIL